MGVLGEATAAGAPSEGAEPVLPCSLFGTPICTRHPHPGPAQSAGSPPITTSPTNTGSQTWVRRRSSSEPSRHGQRECTARVAGPRALCCSGSRAQQPRLESRRKIRCKFFVRGHCPFRSECIYLHELPARRRRQRSWQQPRMPAVSGVAHLGLGWAPGHPGSSPPPLLQVFMTSSSDSSDEEDELCTLEWALTLALLEKEFFGSSYSQEVFLIDLSDSD